jgi:thioredoxin-dependent adenylylsulfate APS reductase
MVVEQRVVLDDWEAGELAVEYDDQEPEEVIRWALETFAPGRIAVCTALQIDGMAILDMAWRIDPNVRVFTVDTGRLPRETHELIARVQEHYGIEVEVYHPDPGEVGRMVGLHGEDLFHKSVPLRLTCCDVRKVRPLVRVLRDLDGWITGLRRDQWATRSNIRKIDIDHDHGGLVKVNPLADWTEEEVWDYVRANDVPYHALYDRGFKSIGCAPCTRAVAPGEDARSGRWWWETDAPKECGMHCAIETGGFEHELEVIVGGNGHNGH